MPGLLVLPTSNDWSISAAPAATRAALSAKLQRMALSLRTIQRARLKAIGVRGQMCSDLFSIFDIWALWGGENGSGRCLKSWCWDCWYCFYRQVPADAVIAGKLGAKPSLLSADAPTSNHWSISAAPAAARAPANGCASSAKLQRMALSLRYTSGPPSSDRSEGWGVGFHFLRFCS